MFLSIKQPQTPCQNHGGILRFASYKTQTDKECVLEKAAGLTALRLSGLAESDKMLTIVKQQVVVAENSTCQNIRAECDCEPINGILRPRCYILPTLIQHPHVPPYRPMLSV